MSSHARSDVATPHSQLSIDTQVEVVLLRDPSDGIAGVTDVIRSPAFFRLNAAAFHRAWYAVAMDASNGKCLASTWFAETSPGHACSGIRGLFGGIQVSSTPLPSGLAQRVMAAMEDELIARRISRVTLTLPPLVYEPDVQAEWLNVLMRTSYRAAPPDLNYHTTVDAGGLEEQMSFSNRAVLQSAERKGIFARALRERERAEAYALNTAQRGHRGRRLALSLEELQGMDAVEPDVLQWFGAFVGERMIAAAICLRDSPATVQVLAIGDLVGAERQQASTIVASHIYRWCRDRGVGLLDFGTASESGVPDEEAAGRYQDLGLVVSPRFTLDKELAA